MAKLEGSGGGTTGKLWRKHGGGYYALLAVGTFLYLELADVIESLARANGVGDFITSELLTFAIQTFLNTFFASFWPVVWYAGVGIEAFYWAGGGYFAWAVLLAWALSRREKELRKELGF
jgi:hypothetical protein